MPMVITDPHKPGNPIVFANDAFCQLTGYARHEILDRNCGFLQGPETDLAVVERIRAAVQAQDTIEVEICNYRKNGDAFCNRLLIEPVRNSSGNLAYFFGSQVDVTAERQRIMALESNNDALTVFAGLLADRTRELAEANDKLQAEITERERIEGALRQLHKMEAIGQLTGGIAHDFNNLIGGVIGSLELVQRCLATGRTSELERYTSAAVTSAQRAAALTQRLLAFARHQPLKPERTDVNRLVAGMEELLQRTLGPAIDVEMFLAPVPQPILCDRNLLENAILNLSINARDAMPNGGRLIIGTAETTVDAAWARTQGLEIKPGTYTTISVTDTGTGMSPAVIARAFDPFFTTKPVGQGTGLGLSMVYGFAKQSKGLARIRSNPGQGTTVQLYLPGCCGSQPESLDLPQRNTHVASNCHTGRVLVVDDEDTFRMVITETLQELGYTTVEAADGPSAMRLLRSDADIDLLVTDIGLPGMSGRQLADAARQARPSLPVLFITGYATDDATGAEMGLGAGMGLLAKPFTLNALAEAIEHMLEAV